MDDVEISSLMRAERERERRRRRDIEVNRLRLRRMRDASDPFSVTNEIFKGVYRLSKELAKELIKELCPLMVAPRRSSAIPIEIMSADMITTFSVRCISILGVIVYVDGSHVAIRAPAEDDHVFLNRKSLNVSLNVMIVRNSGYPHQPWLQTPILNALDGSPEVRYTLFHVRARSTVEQCIGLLKGRFRCLLKDHVLEYAPLKCGRIVHACIVLHNMCLSGSSSVFVFGQHLGAHKACCGLMTGALP
ncbi:hypothetical protein J437_LFUL017909 [Ladona fulva]|uniref:DDE Tnp4 domain-containing protein n=1 Tax=Ladona fulva TaxID=123851 RepID=A0A8K0KKI0_LADFU|nr:hypothetical protein J437_LFUL017909 [Ladona fulva]